ncbi:hypothetical protein PAPYR_1872 [Paratrimastix pyriformis]|uniref:Uncharacterized protein n=1 Tax=Paratrimastix pyriformis TaxID=342808 RepID=A0ABQ8UTK3_9EUKA|nr:hypothetical protein PAPYR_1872 [Paratrimastix pyriformis]
MAHLAGPSNASGPPGGLVSSFSTAALPDPVPEKTFGDLKDDVFNEFRRLVFANNPHIGTSNAHVLLSPPTRTPIASSSVFTFTTFGGTSTTPPVTPRGDMPTPVTPRRSPSTFHSQTTPPRPPLTSISSGVVSSTAISDRFRLLLRGPNSPPDPDPTLFLETRPQAFTHNQVPLAHRQSVEYQALNKFMLSCMLYFRSYMAILSAQEAATPRNPLVALLPKADGGPAVGNLLPSPPAQASHTLAPQPFYRPFFDPRPAPLTPRSAGRSVGRRVTRPGPPTFSTASILPAVAVAAGAPEGSPRGGLSPRRSLPPLRPIGHRPGGEGSATSSRSSSSVRTVPLPPEAADRPEDLLRSHLHMLGQAYFELLQVGLTLATDEAPRQRQDGSLGLSPRRPQPWLPLQGDDGLPGVVSPRRRQEPPSPRRGQVGSQLTVPRIGLQLLREQNLFFQNIQEYTVLLLGHLFSKARLPAIRNELCRVLRTDEFNQVQHTAQMRQHLEPQAWELPWAAYGRRLASGQSPVPSADIGAPHLSSLSPRRRDGPGLLKMCRFKSPLIGALFPAPLERFQNPDAVCPYAMSDRDLDRHAWAFASDLDRLCLADLKTACTAEMIRDRALDRQRREEEQRARRERIQSGGPPPARSASCASLASLAASTSSDGSASVRRVPSASRLASPGLGHAGGSIPGPATALPATALPATALPATALPATALPATALPGLTSADSEEAL